MNRTRTAAESQSPVIAALAVVTLLAVTATAMHQAEAKPAIYSASGGIGREFIVTETAADEPEESPILLNVPLADDLQEYIQNKCKDSGIPYTLVYALIEQESSYNPNAVSDTNDYGLMQINAMNHDWLTETIGVTDFLDPYENCTAGIYMLTDYYREYNDIHMALMAYNHGEPGAEWRRDNGIRATDYSRSIVNIMDRLEAEAND